MKIIPIGAPIKNWEDEPCNMAGQSIPDGSGIDLFTLGQALRIYLDAAQQIPGIPLDKFQAVAKLGKKLGKAMKQKEQTLEITGEQWDLLKSRFCDVGVVARPGQNGGQQEIPIFASLAVRMYIKELVDEAETVKEEENKVSE